jgi:hypothetical protein
MYKWALGLLISLSVFSQPQIVEAQLLQQLVMTPAPNAVVAPTLVQVKGCTGTSTPNTCNLTSNVTAGHTLVSIAVANGGTCTSVTSTPSNVFQPWIISLTGGNRQTVFIARNVASATNAIVAACSGATAFVSQMVYDLSCSAGVAAGDVVGGATGTGGTPTVATVNPVGSSAAEVISSIFDTSNFRTWVPGSGNTIQAEVNASGSTYLGASQDNNTKTGLSGVQPGSITGVSTDPWTMTILGLACAGSASNADTIVDFEGLTNASNPTVTQLNNSTFGVPGTWSISNASTVFTGDTGSALPLVTPQTIGATTYQSGQTLGLAYNTIGGSTGHNITFTFYISYPTISHLWAWETNIPQNDTNGNAYTLDQVNDTSTFADYVAPQLQANGSSLSIAFECKSATGSGTIPVSTSTQYFPSVVASSGGVTVSSFTGSSGTITFTNSGTNNFVSGQSIGLSAFTGGNTGLNGQTVTVLSAGLSNTTFEAVVTGSGYSSGAGAAAGFHTLKIFNSAGSQVGSTLTCLAQPGALQWTNVGFGINGAEPMATGDKLSEDMHEFSYQALALTP